MLFDEPAGPEEEAREKSEAATVAVPAHRPTRAGRKTIPDHLPRVEIVHDVTEEETVRGGQKAVGIARLRHRRKHSR